MVTLSKASKIPAKSWSLQAGSTCPGSIDPAHGTRMMAKVRRMKKAA